MEKRTSRRAFLKLMALAAGSGGVGLLTSFINNFEVSADALTNKNYLPLIKGGVSSTIPTPTAEPTPSPTTPPPVTGGQIIANHSIVDRYQYIPQVYIDQIKKMWVDIPGESHSIAYRKGCELLQALDNRFQVNVTESGTPEGYTNQYLRISRATWGDVNNSTGWIYNYGEEDWYTSDQAIQRTKDHLGYCNTHNLEIAAMGFGWCWDMTWNNPPGGIVDPVHQVRWAGSSVGGSQGNTRWGLDAGDFALTGNKVCMDTYLDATMQYITYCQANGFPTKVFFTTGPVDNDWDTSGEGGYQRHLKHKYIRNFVNSTHNCILFDYADILCWSNNGQQNSRTWTDYGGEVQTYPFIHDDNMLDLDGSPGSIGHIGERGALRLAKALWWLLARIAGWNDI